MAKIKQCKDCKADIPKNAKKCQYCGSKQGINIGSGGLFLILIAVIMIYSAVMPESPKLKPLQTHAATESSEAKASREKAEEAERYAWSLCSVAIKRAAKFPSSVDVSAWDSPAMKIIKGGGYAVSLAFESKNGFGNMLPQMARCDVIKGKLTHFSTSNR